MSTDQLVDHADHFQHRVDFFRAAGLLIEKFDGGTLEADDIGVYAVELAVAGWRVFPLAGKVPAIPNPHPRGSLERLRCKGECGQPGHGVLDATTDLTQIESWWAGPYQGHNIGARVPDHAFVVDVDPRSGGTQSLQELKSAYGELPVTLTAISGRGDGGSHRYYKRPFGKLTSKHLGAGIDIKTSGGYCVVPPSIHPDGRKPYRWVEAPIADPPGWLVDLVRPPVVTPTSRPGHPWRRGQSFGGTSVADDFTASTSWAEILTPHGWRCLDPDGDAEGARWLHPAATSDCSATVKHSCLFVYSPNTPFETTETGDPHGYTRFRAYAVLWHRGDLSAAARAFRPDGAS